MSEQKKRELPETVLFVCTGNTCRSPMAEAAYNAIARNRGLSTRARSAGIAACEGMAASVGATDAMAQYGVDLSLHSAALLTPNMLEDADVVLCMQDAHALYLQQHFAQHAGKIFPLTQYAFGRYTPVSDPFGGDAGQYAQCAEQIVSAVNAIFAQYDGMTDGR